MRLRLQMRLQLRLRLLLRLLPLLLHCVCVQSITARLIAGAGQTFVAQLYSGDCQFIIIHIPRQLLLPLVVLVQWLRCCHRRLMHCAIVQIQWMRTSWGAAIGKWKRCLACASPCTIILIDDVMMRLSLIEQTGQRLSQILVLCLQMGQTFVCLLALQSQLHYIGLFEGRERERERAIMKLRALHDFIPLTFRSSTSRSIRTFPSFMDHWRSSTIDLTLQRRSESQVPLEHKATPTYRLSIASSRTRAASLTSRTTSVIMPGV